MSFLHIEPSDDFLEFVEPVKRYLDPRSSWICGGALRDFPAAPRDWDLFFNSKTSFKKVEKMLRSIGAKEDIKSEYQVTYLTDNKKISLVHYSYYASIEEALSDFDFTINQIGFDGRMITQSSSWATHMVHKELIVIRPPKAPLTRLRRMEKFISRGYTIDQNNLLKMCHVEDTDFIPWDSL